MPRNSSRFCSTARSRASASAGIRNVMRTLMVLFDPTARVRSRAYDERRAHARGGVAGERAPELPLAAPEHRSQLCDIARRGLANAQRASAADPLQPQVVRVLAGVVELYPGGAGLQRL